MGYRSEVVIAFSPETYEGMPEHVKKAFLECFVKPAEQETSRVVFHHDFIKWYSDYEEVQEIEKYLRDLPEEDYAFVRLGESNEDVEYWGHPFDWDVRHISRVEY